MTLPHRAVGPAPDDPAADRRLPDRHSAPSEPRAEVRLELERVSGKEISTEAVMALAEQVGTFDPALTGRELRRLARQLKKRQREQDPRSLPAGMQASARLRRAQDGTAKGESPQKREASPFPRSFAHPADLSTGRAQDEFETWIYGLTGGFVNSSS